jgi:hypothetical protein
MRGFIRFFTTVFLVLLALPPLIFAQAGKAELLGKILDPSGLPVAGARVVAEQQGTLMRIAAVSDQRGEYHVLGLPGRGSVRIVSRESRCGSPSGAPLTFHSSWVP